MLSVSREQGGSEGNMDLLRYLPDMVPHEVFGHEPVRVRHH